MSTLIAVVLATFLGVAFRQVERALLRAGGDRAQAAADQLASLLSPPTLQRLADMQRAARSSAVRDYLEHPTEAAAAVARQRLASLATAGQPAVELLDEQRQPVLVVSGPPPAQSRQPAPIPVASPPSRPGLTGFQVSSGTVFWDALAEVYEERAGEVEAPSDARRLGYVFSRRLMSPAAASDVISRLVGSGAVVEMGNQAGDVWTDLSKVVPAPPVDASKNGVSEYRSADGEARVGASAVIRGTPWAIWVEFPRSGIVAPARTFLTSMLIFGLAFVVAAAVMVRTLSARITTPLHDLTHAAEAIAAGTYLAPVETTRRDEIGRLGVAFNTMAAQVHGVQRELEERVQQRTARLAEAGAELEQHVADLNEARQELDRFFAFSLDMLCIAGTDGYFKRLNPAWSATLGWTDEQFRAKPYLDFVHPDDRGATIERAAALADGAAVVTFENRYQCRDGSYRWLQWKSVPIPNRGIIYAAARDVTEQKATSAHVQALNDQLEHRVSELHALTQELEAFSYSVSHDLRAPLRHVTGFASLLQRSAADRLTEKETRYLRTIVDATGRMGRLIDDLLAFSRMGRTALDRKRTNLDELVRDALKEVSGAATERDIVWTIHPLPKVNADGPMLRLVLVNLLSNAVKYTAGRAPARIEVGVDSGGPDEAVIYVRDNGVGFDMQYAHKLFGVFQRLHSTEQFEGTGIGLANVRRIITRHGGRAWAEGVVDGGATFFFSIPKSAEVSG